MGDNALVPAAEAGVSTRQGFESTEIMRSAETSQTAMAASQKALTEARFVMSMRRPRQWFDIRRNVLTLCQDPQFAAEALYTKPIGKTPDNWKDMDKRERLRQAPKDWPRGFSIRFVEAALFECGNFDVDTTVVFEDESQRITRVTVMDLEKNSAYGINIVTKKTVERRYPPKLNGKINEDIIIGTRTNTYGDLVYILEATDDEVKIKEAANVSKAIRTMGERLLPPHFKREWRDAIERAIMDQAAKDPLGELKKLLDAFANLGVAPSLLDAYLDHPASASTPAEILELRGVCVALANGDCTWKDAMLAKHGNEDGEAAPESEAGKKLADRIAAQMKKTAPAEDKGAMHSAASSTVPQQAVAGAPAGHEPAVRHATTEAPAQQQAATGAQEPAKQAEAGKATDRPTDEERDYMDRVEGATQKRPTLDQARAEMKKRKAATGKNRDMFPE